jgi:hypothetical protein
LLNHWTQAKPCILLSAMLPRIAMCPLDAQTAVSDLCAYKSTSA